jgi:hypothetical protein
VRGTYLKAFVFYKLLDAVCDVEIFFIVLESYVSCFEITVGGYGIGCCLGVFPVAFEDVGT